MTTTTKTLHTIADGVQHAKERFNGLTDTPSLDAQVLLSDITGRDKTQILAYPEHELSEAQAKVLAAALDEITNGVPLPYVLGEWEFYGLPFKLTQNVLIPRPETELLVETALEWLKTHSGNQRIAEVGAGSGCISIALAVNSPTADITAIDISPEALAVAQVNAGHHEINGRIKFLENDLLSGITDRFDMICANLPYIPSKTLKKLSVYTKEPTLALDGGYDGLKFIRRLLKQAPPLLKPGGLVLLEIEAGQHKKAVSLAKKSFPKSHVTVKQDLAGHHRLVVVETPCK